MNKIKTFAKKNKVFMIFVYICFRICGIGYYIMFLFFGLFPKDKYKIVGCNMKGKRYGDNPKYIMDQLVKKHPEFHYVWLLNGNIYVVDVPKEVRIKKNNFINQAYELATAKVWIDSNAKQFGFIKKKSQLYVQTWHGSYGLKKIGRDLSNQSIFDKKNMDYNFSRADLTVSNSKRTSELFRTAFVYSGKILEVGSPRNDIFFEKEDNCKKKVKEFYDIEGKNILLYAPTFRENYDTNAFNIDYKRLKQNIEQKWGGEWVILIRLHPNNIEAAKRFIDYSDYIINATDYDIMQELLVAADVLISDYSSCILDFVTTGKKCVLYASDIEKYKSDRDYYYDLEDLPFPLARNNKELEQVIMEFDNYKYQDELHKLFNSVGLCESGNASELVADYIIEWMGQDGSI